MKISELRARENIDTVLKLSIEQAVDAENEVKNRESCEMVQLCEHPLFSVLVTRNFCPEGREYLCSQYRYTPSKSRRVAQNAAVRLMAQKLVFQAMLKPKLCVPKCVQTDAQMWLPGNHRIRRFDFEKQTVTVFPKHGFSTDGISKEIMFRKSCAKTSELAPEKTDWVLPVEILDERENVFSEPLLNAMPINRVPDGKKRKAACDKAFKALNALHERERQWIQSSQYLDMKWAEYESAKLKMKKAFPGVCLDNVDRLLKEEASEIMRCGEVEISLTHGDFQPGNVLCSREDCERIWLIDWEDIGVRASLYDEMTWLLGSRAPRGLSGRIEAFLNAECDETNRGFRLDVQAPAALALWSFEEWIWILESASRPGIVRIPDGVVQHFRELTRIP